MAFCVDLFKYILYSENKSLRHCLWTPVCHWCGLDGGIGGASCVQIEGV